MTWKPTSRGSRTVLAVSAAAAMVVTALVVTGSQRPASAAEVNPTPSQGSWVVDGRGNGHGHGMSQYGARGAAIAGLKYNQILAFYYPGTKLQGVADRTLRVKITGSSAAVTVAYRAGLTLRWSGHSYAIPAGSTQWRLVPVPAGLALQRLNGPTWVNVNTALPAQADFYGGSSLVRYYRSSALSIDYRGTVGAVSSGATLFAVNRVRMDDYTRGVVPREMPASWQSEAVKAQAVAARSYALYAFEHNAAQAYDICDTTACQVYGGAGQYNSNGTSNGVHEEPGSNAAVSATSNQILSYAARTIFAEFSASNGGMTSSGNQPYFVTKPDPYDNASSGDPYLSWTRTVSAASVAAAYGLRQVTEIDITAREGGGTWGGLVSSGLVRGVAGNGSATSINVTGAGLASAMGLSYRYFHFRAVLPAGHWDTATTQSLHVLRVTGWTFDPAHSDVATTVQVYVDATRYSATANLPRPDVQRAYQTISANHGFALNVPVPGGSHRVCVFGVAMNGTDRTALGCRVQTVSVQPGGHLDRVAKASANKVRVAGWEFDPDADGGPGIVHLYVDATGYVITAASPRPDVQRAYKLLNDKVGFDVSPSVARGKHRVCAYAMNKAHTPGTNHLMGCATLAI